MTRIASHGSALAWDAQKGYVNNVGRSADRTSTVLINHAKHTHTLQLLR